MRILGFEPGHRAALVDLAVLALARADGATALALLDRIEDEDCRVRFYRALAFDACGRRDDSDALLREVAAESGKYADLASAELTRRQRPS